MTANELLTVLIKTDLALSAGVVGVAALRLPARRWLGAQAAYGLWLLPLAAAIAVLQPARVLTIPASATIPIPAITPAVAVPQHPGGSVEVTAAVSLPYDPAPAIALLWAAGVLAAVGWLARGQLTFLKAARQGLAGPAAVGVVQPRVVVPADFASRFSRAERAAILAHEAAHIALQHPRTNALAAMVRVLHWFNPLIHLGAHLMRIDQELACDAAVVEGGEADRGAYARALLKAQLAGRALPLGCYWPPRSEHPLAARLEMLVRREPDSERKALSAWLLGWSAAALSLGVWFAQPPRLELERAGVARLHAVLVPVMTPTGEMTNAVHPDTPSQAQQGAVPLMAPTGDLMPAYIPHQIF